MKLFVAKDFARTARKAGLTDADLCDAVERAECGLVDAHLGSGLIKQRVARSGAGRSAGFRAILFYRRGDLAVFMHLFAKNRQATLSALETEGFRKLANVISRLAHADIIRLVEAGKWQEVLCGESLSQ